MRALIFKFVQYLRCKLAQFGGDGGIAGGEGQYAEFQTQDLRGLREIGRGRRAELLLQREQSLGFGQYRAEFGVVVQQVLEWLSHNF